MKSLIHTNPETKHDLWCVDNIESNISIEQYIQVVDLGFRDDTSHVVENFKWVEQPAGVSMQTHKWDGSKFVDLPDVTPLSGVE